MKSLRKNENIARITELIVLNTLTSFQENLAKHKKQISRELVMRVVKQKNNN